MTSSRKSSYLYTVEDYLRIERDSQDRHEYLDGEIFAMAGESGEHADITVNLVVSLGSQLAGSDCRVRSKDTKVRSGPVPKLGQSTTGLYSYPDLVIVCGEPTYHDKHKDVILNPVLIIEVLSPATEAFDRGEKFRRYQKWNPTLREYLLVAQDKMQIEHYSRVDDENWSYHCIDGEDQCTKLAAVNAVLKLVDVYARIDFAD